MDWISIDTDISEDSKIQFLINEEGPEAYGVWNLTLTKVAKEIDIDNEKNGYVDAPGDRSAVEFLSLSLSVAPTRLEEIFDTCAEFGLISKQEWEDGNIYFPNLFKRNQVKNYLQKQKAGRKGGKQGQTAKRTGSDREANGKRSGSNKDKDVDKDKEKNNNNGSDSDESEPSESVQELWNFYCDLFEPYYSPRTFSDKRQGKIDSRLDEYTVQELKNALKAMADSDYLLGESDDNNKFYAKPEYCFRNDEKVEEWLNEYEEHDEGWEPDLSV